MDLKVQVIASNITNLTDARYFAAYGVDYLLFDLGQINVASIKEIVDWVSGPKTLLMLGAEQIDQIDEAIIKLSPYAIGSKHNDADLSYLAGHVKIMELVGGQDTLTAHLDDMKYSSFDGVNIDHPLIINGGEEAKVGFKNYEDLDEVMEALIIEY